MSMMGELNYFLRLQIKQLNHGTFLNQTKYFKELLKKFDMENCKDILMEEGSGKVQSPEQCSDTLKKTKSQRHLCRLKC